MELNARIYIAGHRGMVGGAILRRLNSLGYQNLITASSSELDLRIAESVYSFFEKNKPEYVFLAAARVGGIIANHSYPAEFIYDNLMIACNVIHASHKYKVKKLLNLGSSCIYPKFAEQPIREDSLLTGLLEPTNEAYAIAKIAGIKMCQSYNRQYGSNFISVMPSNLYGIGDNYHPENSHVIPALIRRFHEAKQSGKSVVEIWGSGTPLREFMYSEDLAEACIFLMETYDQPELINAGSGDEISIAGLAALIAETTGFSGSIIFDKSKPDGTPRKLMDNSRLRALGFKPKTGLRSGLKMAYDDFLKKHLIETQ